QHRPVHDRVQPGGAGDPGPRRPDGRLHHATRAAGTHPADQRVRGGAGVGAGDEPAAAQAAVPHHLPGLVWGWLMGPMTLISAGLGALAAVGVLILVRELLPATPPLGAALRRLHPDETPERRPTVSVTSMAFRLWPVPYDSLA